MAYTITIHNGSAVCQKHNNRDKETIEKEKHIDPNGEHFTIKHIEIKAAYYQFFGKPLDDYNKKLAKKNPDRIKTMQQYINEIFAKKDTLKQATKPAYEMIVQIGDKDNAPDPEICKAVLSDYMLDFEARNKTLKVIGAYIHADEQGGIHAHLDYIPCAECSRGMALQPSLSKALEQLGYKNKNHKDTAQIQFQNAERQKLTEMCNLYGLEIEAAQGGKKHLETELFKLQQDVENAQDYYEARKKEFAEAKKEIDQNYDEAITNYQNEVNLKLEKDKTEYKENAIKELSDYRRDMDQYVEERKNKLLEDALKKQGLTHELQFNFDR